MDIQYFIECIVGIFKPRYLILSFSKYNTQFTAGERQRTMVLLQEAGVSEYYASVNFAWNDMLGKDAIGCFYPFTPNTIYVTSSFKFDCNSEGFKKLIGPIGHELKHREQFKTFKLLYFLLSMPIIRNFTIEPSAIEVATKINKYYKIREEEWL